MPANRSRTAGWRRCLRQIHERNGALEIALAGNENEEQGAHHLIWRVKLLNIGEHEILVEQPMTLGRPVPLQEGAKLVVIISVGQNRWMFSTVHNGSLSHKANDRQTLSAIRLPLPDEVQRCQRRSHYRIETATLNLPEVEVWPLLDPRSALIAERASQLEAEGDQPGAMGGMLPASSLLRPDDLLPEVGPKFIATLVNIGGGGVGLRVSPESGAALGRHKLYWLRLSLPPELTSPVCASAQLVHTHLELTQHTYAGLSFDFSFNPAHQRFVADQICRFIALQQKAMLMNDDESSERRRTA